jgi:chromosome segregation ATPase
VQAEDNERALADLSEEMEQKLQEEVTVLERERTEKEGLVAEFDETRRQLEEDVDREIEELKEKYEAKLATEREAALRLKGENGIMRKKFTALQKEIEDQKDAIQSLFADKKSLHAHIESLEKDIQGLKKEIRERDETIGDKEKRIYDLKKKNQELEKFKFVLDYKIKELKKQIEPREVEIMDMKEQIKDMDQELERYHKNNSALDLTVSDLRLKLDGMQREILSQRTRLGDADIKIRGLKTELHETVQHIQDPKALKESVKKMYQKHVTEAVPSRAVEPDIAAEYARQREYLEKSVESLKRKLSKMSDMAKSDNMRMMGENVALVKEINDLRREIKQMKLIQRQQATSGGTSGFDGAGGAEVQRLRQRVEELEAGSQVANRPTSRERLPTMEGVTPAP